MVGPAAREQESLLVGFLALQSMDTFLQVFFSRTCVPPGVGQTSIHSIRAFAFWGRTGVGRFVVSCLSSAQRESASK